MFRSVGFEGDGLDTALGVSYLESDGYTDAVGDVGLVDDKWGPSIGLLQVRSLKHPHRWGETDNWRIAFALRDPFYNAAAAFAISRGGTNWDAWTMYENGRYLTRKGVDFPLKSGHERADQWRLGIPKEN